MFKSIIATILLSIGLITATAKPVAYIELNRGQTTILLHDEQRHCKGEFFYADVMYAGRPLKACWRLVEAQGRVWVHLVDEEGDQGALPAEEFGPPKTV